MYLCDVLFRVRTRAKDLVNIKALFTANNIKNPAKILLTIFDRKNFKHSIIIQSIYETTEQNHSNRHKTLS